MTVAAVWVTVGGGERISCLIFLVAGTTSLASSFCFSVSLGFFMQFVADVVFVFSGKGVREELLRRLMRKVNRASFAEAVVNVVVCLEMSRKAHFTRVP